MHEKFKEIRFKSAAKVTINQAIEILAEYANEGLIVSLRQLYYQFVQRDLIPNNVKSYRRLAKTMSDARLAGLIDWQAIEDRGRRPALWSYSKDAREAIDKALEHFSLNRSEGQKYHVELWVEKDALSAVLRPLAAEHFAPMMVNRGYSSTSAMYAAAQRMLAAEAAGKKIVVLYLGDFDPSGEDMVRDIEERPRMFGVADLTMEKIALTWDQIKTHKPPPNPAKLSDPRAHAYVRAHGRQSWEVDALSPRQLATVIREAFARFLDLKKIEKIKKEEKRQVEEAKRKLGEKTIKIAIHDWRPKSEEPEFFLEVSEKLAPEITAIDAHSAETIESLQAQQEEHDAEIQKLETQIVKNRQELERATEAATEAVKELKAEVKAKAEKITKLEKQILTLKKDEKK